MEPRLTEPDDHECPTCGRYRDDSATRELLDAQAQEIARLQRERDEARELAHRLANGKPWLVAEWKAIRRWNAEDADPCNGWGEEPMT